MSNEAIRRGGEKATSKIDLMSVLAEKGLKRNACAKKAGIGNDTLKTIIDGGTVMKSTAEKVCKVLDLQVDKAFEITRDKRPFTPKTIVNYVNLVSAILQQAVDDDVLDYNPATKAKKPKLAGSGTKKPNFLTIDELQDVLIHMDQEPLKWRTMFYLMLTLGDRRGEQFGLKWNAVDLENKCVSINNNLIYSRKHGLYETTPKTDSSNRKIALSDSMVQLLKEYKEWYDKRKEMYGNRWHDTDFIFFQERSGNEGKPMNPSAMRDWLNRFTKKNGLKHINPHALRHTMASLMIRNHVDPITAAHVLGHSNATMILTVYGHMVDEANMSVSRELGDYVFDLASSNHMNPELDKLIVDADPSVSDSLAGYKLRIINNLLEDGNTLKKALRIAEVSEEEYERLTIIIG
jgi:integrase